MYNKRVIFISVLSILFLVACGSLSDPDTVWNQTREETPEGVQVDTGATTYTPGVFEGTGEGGHYGPISVAVTIDDDGRITAVEVTDHNETPEFADRAFGYLIPDVLEVQSANVDTVSGATATSVAFINAVVEALGQAGGAPAVAESGEANYTPGVFEGTGEGGHYGPISVAVTIDDEGRIMAVEVTEHNETPEFADRAFGYLIPDVLEVQSADVDTVSGATATSVAFINAVEAALAEAQ